MLLKITVTGADDSVCPSQLVKLAEEFPRIEFGLLLSRNSTGQARFPSHNWLKYLVTICSRRNMQFSGHLCDDWVSEILDGKWPHAELSQIDVGIIRLFSRWQLNTRSIPHAWSQSGFRDILDMAAQRRQRFILQYDNANNALIDWSLKHGGVDIVFDLSHGTGILPETWPVPLDGINCGYAGGLAPDNVADQLAQIKSVTDDHTNFWIDAESSLRTGKMFDIDKVHAFMKAAILQESTIEPEI